MWWGTATRITLETWTMARWPLRSGSVWSWKLEKMGWCWTVGVGWKQLFLRSWCGMAGFVRLLLLICLINGHHQLADPDLFEGGGLYGSPFDRVGYESDVFELLPYEDRWVGGFVDSVRCSKPDRFFQISPSGATSSGQTRQEATSEGRPSSKCGSKSGSDQATPSRKLLDALHSGSGHPGSSGSSRWNRLLHDLG